MIKNRLFPYAVTVGSLTLFFVILMIILLAQKKLQPAWVILGTFILIALFLAGLIETAIQLFGNVSYPPLLHPSAPTFPPLSLCTSASYRQTPLTWQNRAT